MHRLGHTRQITNHDEAMRRAGCEIAEIFVGIDEEHRMFGVMIVPTLCVVTQPRTLRVPLNPNAARPLKHSHAERGNDHSASRFAHSGIGGEGSDRVEQFVIGLVVHAANHPITPGALGFIQRLISIVQPKGRLAVG